MSNPKTRICSSLNVQSGWLQVPFFSIFHHPSPWILAAMPSTYSVIFDRVLKEIDDDNLVTLSHLTLSSGFFDLAPSPMCCYALTFEDPVFSTPLLCSSRRFLLVYECDWGICFTNVHSSGVTIQHHTDAVEMESWR
ncbi:hypothetical protein JAAARDRAFT_63234 [Jaapia argillacea MUCL 33604]|uniref:Uncharacterized protein n=1 Tax=Jaapia argillacea MUCL 33604 TaxID=933084 RepID=A0A067P623_9AGAM|nr:hypothetical protein JAAARDRAFT_63234 [Jaapia argillacea MUCL 33604]